MQHFLSQFSFNSAWHSNSGLISVFFIPDQQFLVALCPLQTSTTRGPQTPIMTLHQHPLEGSVEYRLLSLLLEFLIQWVWSGIWESSFLARHQPALILLVQDHILRTTVLRRTLHMLIFSTEPVNKGSSLGQYLNPCRILGEFPRLSLCFLWTKRIEETGMCPSCLAMSATLSVCQLPTLLLQP